MSAPPPYPEPPPRPQREVLSALADDLAAHPPPVAPVAPVTPLPPRNRPSAPRLAPAEARTEHRPEPRMPAPQPAVEPAAVDQSLAEMAQRLEAALRKPKAVDTRAQVAPEPQDEADDVAASAPPPPPPRPVRPAEAKPVRAEANVKEGKALYDTLEQEMASLLGRPASKN